MISFQLIKIPESPDCPPSWLSVLVLHTILGVRWACVLGALSGDIGVTCGVALCPFHFYTAAIKRKTNKRAGGRRTPFQVSAAHATDVFIQARFIAFTFISLFASRGTYIPWFFFCIAYIGLQTEATVFLWCTSKYIFIRYVLHITAHGVHNVVVFPLFHAHFSLSILAVCSQQTAGIRALCVSTTESVKDRPPRISRPNHDTGRHDQEIKV